MRYEILLAPSAVTELRRLRAHDRAKVVDAFERHLRRAPAKLSRTRIKRLRGLSRPQFRLRVDDIRVFYDVEGSQVEILAIISKAQAEQWLKQKGGRREEGSTGKGEG